MKLNDIEPNGPELTKEELELVAGGYGSATNYGQEKTMSRPRPKADDHWYGGSDADRSKAPILRNL